MRSTRQLAKSLLAFAIASTIFVSFFISPRETLSQTSTPITGYAWSDTIGWVSFNCSDLGTCATSNYGLSIAADGSISGYAWSENIGWISANSADLSGCPTAPCTARMDELSLKGWMKVLSANDAQNGGWDGFISLSGASPSYGPTLSGGILSGYAWGDMNVGWLSFNAGTGYIPVQTSWLPVCANQYTCTDATHRQNACQGSVVESCSGALVCLSGACTTPPAPSTAPGDELTIAPRLVRTGGTALVSWNVADATSCTVTEDSASIDDSWSGISSATASCPLVGNACRTGSISDTVTYTLSCTGPGGNFTQTAKVYSNPSWQEL